MTNDDGGFFGKLLDKVFGAGAEKKDNKAEVKKSIERGQKEAKKEESERREHKRDVRKEMVKKAFAQYVNSARTPDEKKERSAEDWPGAEERRQAGEREQDQNELER